MQINSPSNNFGCDLTNHEEFVNMREDDLEDSLEGDKDADYNLQAPLDFKDVSYFEQPIRRTINHENFYDYKEFSGSSSFMQPQYSDSQRISFAMSLNSKNQKREQMLIKKYQDKVHHLHEKNCRLRKENEELAESLKDETERNSYLTNENNRLYYLQHSIEIISYNLRCKKVQIHDLSDLLSTMLEQLSRSETCISKFVKIVKEQDEVHESSVKIFKDSESMLKEYYDQKLINCLERYEEIKSKDKVEKGIQTNDYYDVIVRENLTEYKNQQNKTIERIENLKNKYAELYKESMLNLKESVSNCKKLENKLKSKKRIDCNDKSMLVQNFRTTINSNKIKETFILIFIFVSLAIQIIFKI